MLSAAMDQTRVANPSEDFAEIDRNSKAIEDTTKCLAAARDADAVCDLRLQLATSYNERGFRWYKRVEFHNAEHDYTKAVELLTADSSNCPIDSTLLSTSLYNRATVMYRMSEF